MSVTININKLSLCHRSSGGYSAATLPDVCWTPTPAGPVPLPYPNIATEKDLANGTTTVKADGGNMCANFGSKFSKSTGDEPGSLGGIISGTFIKQATWLTYAFNVKLEGKGACRLTDKMFHNHENTLNTAGKVHPPVPPAKTLDCKELAKLAQEGDIVLRSTPGSDSDLIRKLGKCDYSHSGIVTRNAAGELVVVDAYPRTGSAVGEETVEDFFCSKEHSTPTGTPPDKGLVARPNDQAAAKKAAEWAQKQTEKPDYEFNIFSDWKANGKDVYCSDFVHRSYQNAGVELVPDKMDFFSAANKKNTLDGLRSYLKTGARGWEAQAGAYTADDEKLAKNLLEELKGKTTEYITPCQVGMNSSVTTVGTFP